MPSTVRDWMSSPVVVVDPDSSVSYALTLMRRRKIHSVIVDISDKNPAYGIVTTTNIRDKIVAEERNPAETTVREIMSGPIVTASPDWSLKECSRVMQERRIHHLPVADDERHAGRVDLRHGYFHGGGGDRLEGVSKTH